MSRVAKAPVELPKGVEFKQDGNVVTLKGGNGELSIEGGNGELSIELNSEVELKQEENLLTLHPRSGSRFSTAIAGTMRAILANMAKGVTDGFEKKLELKGVGYRAQAQGKNLNLSLGFSGRR
jgi:large subunit ribosomal protein L6